jgi:FkbM family methyltransferase
MSSCSAGFFVAGASPYVLHGETAIQTDAPLTVNTPPAPWAYAVALPLQPGPAGYVLVEARIRVVSGSVGVSCACGDLKSLADERVLDAAGSLTKVEILAPAEHAAWLLVRNGAEASSSTFEIHDARWHAVPPQEPPLSRLRPIAGWSRYYGTSGETLAERVRVQRYLRLDAPVHEPWLEGLTLTIQPGDQLSRAAFVSGLYEPNTAIQLRRLLQPGGVFFDVGANVGVFSLLGSRWVGPSGQVFAFEPSTRELARLREQISTNHLENVTVVAAAVSDRPGSTELRVAPDSYAGLNTTGERFAYDNVGTATVERVPVVTLDELAAERGLARVDVIKLDVEGSELAALRGAADLLQRHRPALVLEVFAASLRAHGATVADLDGFLQAAGYRFFAIEDETAGLRGIEALSAIDEQNVVALPRERPAPADAG